MLISFPEVSFQTSSCLSLLQMPNQKKHFVEIRRSLHAIERIACSVKYNEPVLLVGETGTGKTTLVQNLAARLGQRLTVLVHHLVLVFYMDI